MQNGFVYGGSRSAPGMQYPLRVSLQFSWAPCGVSGLNTAFEWTFHRFGRSATWCRRSSGCSSVMPSTITYLSPLVKKKTGFRPTSKSMRAVQRWNSLWRMRHLNWLVNYTTAGPLRTSYMSRWTKCWEKTGLGQTCHNQTGERVGTLKSFGQCRGVFCCQLFQKGGHIGLVKLLRRTL